MFLFMIVDRVLCVVNKMNDGASCE